MNKTWLCNVAVKGMNTLTKNFLRQGNLTERAGIVSADFPSAGLIRQIVKMNPDYAGALDTCRAAAREVQGIGRPRAVLK